MRDLWDNLHKDLLAAALEDAGPVTTGLDVSTAAQRMDVVFRPDPARRALYLQRGLLGALVDVAVCNLEPFRQTPGADAVEG